jgi:hypothetical protein
MEGTYVIQKAVVTEWNSGLFNALKTFLHTDYLTIIPTPKAK